MRCTNEAAIRKDGAVAGVKSPELMAANYCRSSRVRPFVLLIGDRLARGSGAMEPALRHRALAQKD